MKRGLLNTAFFLCRRLTARVPGHSSLSDFLDFEPFSPPPTSHPCFLVRDRPTQVFGPSFQRVRLFEVLNSRFLRGAIRDRRLSVSTSLLVAIGDPFLTGRDPSHDSLPVTVQLSGLLRRECRRFPFYDG